MLFNQLKTILFIVFKMYFICSTNFKSIDFEDMRNDFKLPNMQWLEDMITHQHNKKEKRGLFENLEMTHSV